MKEPQTIYFTEKESNTDEITTWCCVKMTWYYLALSAKKIYRTIDKIVHSYAWLVLFLSALLFFLVSSIFIRLAREERDESCQRQYKLEQQVESLKCQLEVSNEQGR